MISTRLFDDDRRLTIGDLSMPIRVTHILLQHGFEYADQLLLLDKEALRKDKHMREIYFQDIKEALIRCHLMNENHLPDPWA